jgi:hypothetical protein
MLCTLSGTPLMWLSRASDAAKGRVGALSSAKSAASETGEAAAWASEKGEASGSTGELTMGSEYGSTDERAAEE